LAVMFIGLPVSQRGFAVSAAYATEPVVPNRAQAVTILPLWLINSRRLLFSLIFSSFYLRIHNVGTGLTAQRRRQAVRRGDDHALAAVVQKRQRGDDFRQHAARREVPLRHVAFHLRHIHRIQRLLVWL